MTPEGHGGFQCSWCSASFKEAEHAEAVAHAQVCSANPMVARCERAESLLESARAMADQRGAVLATLREELRLVAERRKDPAGDLAKTLLSGLDGRMTQVTKAEMDCDKMRKLLSDFCAIDYDITDPGDRPKFERLCERANALGAA